jgi:hypothetical protein
VAPVQAERVRVAFPMLAGLLWALERIAPASLPVERGE